MSMLVREVGEDIVEEERNSSSRGASTQALSGTESSGEPLQRLAKPEMASSRPYVSLHEVSRRGTEFPESSVGSAHQGAVSIRKIACFYTGKKR